MTTDVTIAGGSRENDKLALTDLSDKTPEEIARFTRDKFSYGDSRSWRNNSVYYSLRCEDGDFMGVKNNKTGVIVAYQLDRYGSAGSTTYNMDGTTSFGLSWETHVGSYDWDKFILALTVHDSVQKNWDIVQLRVLTSAKALLDNLYIVDGNNYAVRKNLNDVFESVHVLQKGISEWPVKVTRTATNIPIVMDNKIKEMIV